MNPVRDKYYYVYVLQSQENDNFYTGKTNNLRKRYKEHQEGKSSYTRGRGPYRLIYYEACLNHDDAVAGEKYLKTGMDKRYLKNRMKRFLSLNGMNEGAVRFGPSEGSP